MRQSFIGLTPTLWVTQSEAYATNSGVFISEGQACLIDPGLTPEEIHGIARFVRDMEATPRALILTHGHWDHLLGVEHFPGVTVITHARYAETLREHGAELQRQVAAWESQSGTPQIRTFVVPQPTQTFAGTLTLPVGSQKLTLIEAPGHALDQIVVYHAATHTLWAADMLSDLEIPFIDSLTAYEATLERISKLEIAVLIPGHGYATSDPAEIRGRLAEDRAYLTGLRQRVAQAVEEGKSVEETTALCSDLPYRYPEENAAPHRKNVEIAYLELGGKSSAA